MLDFHHRTAFCLPFAQLAAQEDLRNADGPWNEDAIESEARFLLHDGSAPDWNHQLMQTDWPFDWKYNYHAQVYNKMRTMVHAPDQIPFVLRPGQLWTVSIEPLVEMSHHLLVSLIEHLVWTGPKGLVQHEVHHNGCWGAQRLLGPSTSGSYGAIRSLMWHKDQQAACAL